MIDETPFTLVGAIVLGPHLGCFRAGMSPFFPGASRVRSSGPAVENHCDVARLTNRKWSLENNNKLRLLVAAQEQRQAGVEHQPHQTRVPFSLRPVSSLLGSRGEGRGRLGLGQERGWGVGGSPGAGAGVRPEREGLGVISRSPVPPPQQLLLRVALQT